MPSFLTDPAALYAALVALVALVFGPRYLRVASLKQQLSAKDDVIETNEQTIQSLKDRLDALERINRSLGSKVEHLEHQVVELALRPDMAVVVDTLKKHEADALTRSDRIVVALDALTARLTKTANER